MMDINYETYIHDLEEFHKELEEKYEENHKLYFSSQEPFDIAYWDGRCEVYLEMIQKIEEKLEKIGEHISNDPEK